MKLFLGSILLLAGWTGAFAQTENNVVFNFYHKAGNQPLELGSTTFPVWNGKIMTLKRAEFYISEIKLLRADSSVLSLDDVYLLVNAQEPGNSYPAGQWDVGNVIGITLHLGVDSAHNHLDPSTYPVGHPLGHQKNPMHWGWLAGYRFMAIEGRVDNNSDGNPESDLEFHNIGDPLYKTVQLSGSAQAKNGTLQLNIDLDYARLFQNMSLSGNLIQHGGGPANDLMMENAAHESFLKWTQSSSGSEVLANAQNVRITPNPCTTEARIRYELAGSGQLDMVLTNTLGQPVQSSGNLPPAGVSVVNTSSCTNGIYQCAFYRNNRLIARKQFIINK